MSFKTGDKVLLKRKELVKLYRKQNISVSYSNYLANRLVGAVWEVEDVPDSVWFDIKHRTWGVRLLKKDLEEIASKINDDF